MTGGTEPADPSPGTDETASTPVVEDVPGAELVPYQAPAPFTRSVQRMTRLGFGAAGTVTAAARAAVSRVRARDEVVVAADRARSNALSLVPGAVIGVGLVAEQRFFDAAAAVESRVIRVRGALSLRDAGTVVAAPRGPGRVGRYLEYWRERGEVEQSRNRVLLGALVGRLVPELADAIVARIDLNKIMAAIPVEQLLEGVDVGALVQRIDIGAIISSIDMGTLLAEVLDAMDLPEVIRQSTTSVGGDTIDSVRSQAMGADALVDRVADRLLFRRRNGKTPEPTPDPTPERATEPTTEPVVEGDA